MPANKGPWLAIQREPWQGWLGIGALLLAALTAAGNLPQPWQSSTAAAVALFALLASGAWPWRVLRGHPLPWLILAFAAYCALQSAAVAQPLPSEDYLRQLTLAANPLKVLVYACVFGVWLARYPQWTLRSLQLLAIGWLLWALASMPWTQLTLIATGVLRLRLGYAENLTGAFAALCLVIGLYHAWRFRQQSASSAHAALLSDGWALLSLWSLAILLFAQSRGAWIAAAVGVFVLWVMGRESSREARVAPRRQRRGWLMLALMTLLVTAYAVRPSVMHRMDSGGTSALRVLTGSPISAAAPSVGLRIELWRFAIERIAAHPFRGCGLASIQPMLAHSGIQWQGYVPPHLHNTPLQVAVGLGLPGLTLVASAFLLPLYDTLRAWQRQQATRPELSLLLALAMIFLTVNLFDYLAWSNGYMRAPLELVLGCVIATSLRWRRDQEATSVA